MTTESIYYDEQTGEILSLSKQEVLKNYLIINSKKNCKYNEKTGQWSITWHCACRRTRNELWEQQRIF